MIDRPDPLQLSRRSLGIAFAGGWAAVAGAGSAAAQAAKPAWTVKTFEGFWRNPRIEVVRKATYLPEITAWWPFAPQPLVGSDLYIRTVVTLLELVPDIRLTVEDAAEIGDIHFVRWIARGTPPVGPTEWTGAGCVRTRDGEVTENHIFSDHPVFQRLAETLART